jgi:NADH dehydrogenase
LTQAITGKGKMRPYKPVFHGTMVSIGGRYGVARVGTPGFMVSLPSFFAMFTKHFINIVYFVQVLGWNKIWHYLKHEFFTIRNCRSFVGGHLSNRTPSFLLVPLRLWLGVAWLFEGVMKIIDGPELDHIWLGIGVMVVSGLANLYVSKKVLYPVARRTESAALEADAAHLLTDVYTSLGVAFGLLLVKVTG